MEEESHNHNQPDSPPSPPPSPPLPPPSSSSVSSAQTEDGDGTHQYHQQELEPQYRITSNFLLFGASSSATLIVDDDTWYCFVIVVPFWLLVSIFVIFGIYGYLVLQLSTNDSILLQANTFFVQTIKAEQAYQNSRTLMLYGFHKPPPLDVEIPWFETHNVVVNFDEHKEWLYHLNKGSKVDISYLIKSPSSAALSLVIAKGRNGLTVWMDDPSDPNATFSWNIMFGSGKIHKEIPESDFYYIAVGNLNSQKVEVQLNFTVNALVYNTTGANYACSLDHHKCSLTLGFLHTNAAVLTSPGPTEGTSNDKWYVEITYGPRWITYFGGSVVMSILMLLAFKFCKTSQTTTTTVTDAIRFPAGDTGSARNPLLVHKDDLLSDDSTSDSPSLDEEDLQGSSNKRICVICCDAPRDCFFLPCGHAVSCYACATRIKEGDGLCPICQKATKKVQRIFRV